MYTVLKKVPEYRYPLYRSTGNRFKKLFLIWFLVWFKKVISKHTTRTLRFLFAPFHREEFLFAPFHHGEFLFAPFHNGTQITNKTKNLEPSHIFYSPRPNKAFLSTSHQLDSAKYSKIWFYCAFAHVPHTNLK